MARIQADDDAFIERAARRGIFAYVRHSARPEMEHAIDIVLNRYAEFSRLRGALRTGGVIEQAKGIVMECHGINPDDAFAEPRTRAERRPKRVRRRPSGHDQLSTIQTAAGRRRLAIVHSRPSQKD